MGSAEKILLFRFRENRVWKFIKCACAEAIFLDHFLENEVLSEKILFYVFLLPSRRITFCHVFY